MVRGKSGRIVLEVDPVLKDTLYAALGDEGVTLKEWFLGQAIRYIKERTQPSLFNSEYISKSAPHRKKKSDDE